MSYTTWYCSNVDFYISVVLKVEHIQHYITKIQYFAIVHDTKINYALGVRKVPDKQREKELIQSVDCENQTFITRVKGKVF